MLFKLCAIFLYFFWSNAWALSCPLPSDNDEKIVNLIEVKSAYTVYPNSIILLKAHKSVKVNLPRDERLFLFNHDVPSQKLDYRLNNIKLNTVDHDFYILKTKQPFLVNKTYNFDSSKFTYKYINGKQDHSYQNHPFTFLVQDIKPNNVVDVKWYGLPKVRKHHMGQGDGVDISFSHGLMSAGGIAIINVNNISRDVKQTFDVIQNDDNAQNSAKLSMYNNICDDYISFELGDVLELTVDFISNDGKVYLWKTYPWIVATGNTSLSWQQKLRNWWVRWRLF